MRFKKLKKVGNVLDILSLGFTAVDEIGHYMAKRRSEIGLTKRSITKNRNKAQEYLSISRSRKISNGARMMALDRADMHIKWMGTAERRLVVLELEYEEIKKMANKLNGDYWLEF